MEQEKKKGTTKKAIFFVIGAVLIIGTFAGDNLNHITDWSTGELVGYNICSIIAILGGIYLVYLGVKK
jgi:threonine/homoserine/homoserine lactone efflux protein